MGRSFKPGIALALVATLAGCANASTRTALHNAEDGCRAGNQQACAAYPNIKAQADQESADNAKLTAGIILLPLLILGAAAAASQPVYQQPDVIIIRNRGYGYGY